MWSQLRTLFLAVVGYCQSSSFSKVHNFDHFMAAMVFFTDRNFEQLIVDKAVTNFFYTGILVDASG